MVDTITTDLDPVPARSAPSTFSSRMDTWLGKISTWTTEANALATGANTNKLAAEAAQTAAELAETNAEAAEVAAEAASLAASASANATIWLVGNTYAAGDVVLDPGDNYNVYASQQGSNTGNTPNTDTGVWWVKILTPKSELHAIALYF